MNLYDTLFSGAWVEQGDGGSSETVLYNGSYTSVELGPGLIAASVPMGVTVSFSDLPKVINVIYDEDLYTLPLVNKMDVVYGQVDGDGMPVFSTYPIALVLTGDSNDLDTMMIVTPSVETNEIKAYLGGTSGDDDSVLLESLDVTENGDYYADERMGWDEVHVAVVPSVSMGNLKLTNQTGVMLYAESFSVTDEALVSNTSEPIIISNNSTKNVAVPFASATTAYISFDLILKCATSAGDISNLVCTVTAPSSSVPGSDFSAIVHGTYRPSDPGDTNMRAIVHFYGFIPNGMVSEMSVTLTLS